MQYPDSQVQPGEEVTLATCDDEPIQFPGSIQPHGVLLVLNQQDYMVEVASANTEQHFQKPLQDVLGKPLSELLGAEAAELLLRQLSQLTISAYPQTVTTFADDIQAEQVWVVLAHQFADKLILEFELTQKSRQKESSL